MTTHIDDAVTPTEEQVNGLIKQSFGKKFRIVPFPLGGKNIAGPQCLRGRERAGYFVGEYTRVEVFPWYRDDAIEFARLYTGLTGQEVSIKVVPDPDNQ